MILFLLPYWVTEKNFLNFFSEFSDTNYLFIYNKELNKYINNILVYKENYKIKGALFYTHFLNTAFLEFIAIKSNLVHKNVSFALLNHYF